MHLVTDDTPTGYAINAVLKDNGWFEDTRVDPYGEPFPLLENDTIIIGNFTVDPRDDYSSSQPDRYWYFPTYEPKKVDKHVYHNEKVSSALMVYAVLDKLRNEVFYGDQDNVFSNLMNALQAYSGKKLQYLNPKYSPLVEVAQKILTYANMYKEKAQRSVVESYLSIGKADDEEVNMLVDNVLFNNTRYIEERLAHAQMFSTVLNADNHPRMDVSVVHAEQELGLIANEQAKRLVEKGSMNYMSVVYKNGYVIVVSNIFEELVPAFGPTFSYHGGAGVYSFFMTGLKDDTLYRAMKEMFHN